MMRNIALFCLLVVLATACNNSNESGTATKNNTKAQTEALSVEQFKQKMDATNNKMVVDLRTHGEMHQIGPIIGARNFDYNAGKLQLLTENINKDTSYFVYCASGSRGSKASQDLLKAGATKVYELKGGINAWKTAGYPVAKHSH